MEAQLNDLTYSKLPSKLGWSTAWYLSQRRIANQNSIKKYKEQNMQ